VGIFPEGKDSRGDHGLGRLVEFRFKGPPGTISSYITTHIIGTSLRLMGVPMSEVGYTPAMPRREDHEVYKDMWWHWKNKKKKKKKKKMHKRPQCYVIRTVSVLLISTIQCVINNIDTLAE